MDTDVDKVTLQMIQLNTKKELIQSKYDQVMNAMKIMMGLSMDKNITVETAIAYQDISNYTAMPTLDVKLVETKDKLLKSRLNTLKKSQLSTVMLYGSYGAVGYG